MKFNILQATGNTDGVIFIKGAFQTLSAGESALLFFTELKTFFLYSENECYYLHAFVFIYMTTIFTDTI